MIFKYRMPAADREVDLEFVAALSVLQALYDTDDERAIYISPDIECNGQLLTSDQFRNVVGSQA